MLNPTKSHIHNPPIAWAGPAPGSIQKQRGTGQALQTSYLRPRTKGKPAENPSLRWGIPVVSPISQEFLGVTQVDVSLRKMWICHEPTRGISHQRRWGLNYYKKGGLLRKPQSVAIFMGR